MEEKLKHLENKMDSVARGVERIEVVLIGDKFDEKGVLDCVRENTHNISKLKLAIRDKEDLSSIVESHETQLRTINEKTAREKWFWAKIVSISSGIAAIVAFFYNLLK